MGRGGGEQDNPAPIDDVCIDDLVLTADEVAAIEKGYQLIAARRAYDAAAMAEIRGDRGGNPRELHLVWYDMSENVTDGDVSTFGKAIEKIRLWRMAVEK